MSILVDRSSYYLRQTFAALQYPNFRLWFFGQMFSMIGSWMQSTAQGYLVFELTQSSAWLGYVGFIGGIPAWIFTLFAGVVADRISRRNLLIAIQSIMMLLAFILAALTLTHLVQPWHILILAFFLGTANAFDAPARQSFILEMVDRKTLPNAIALNSTMFTSAVVVGPAIGGLAYAWLGPGWCFAANGLSFVAVIIALALMSLQPLEKRPGKMDVIQDLTTGLRYVKDHAMIRVLILNIGVAGLLGLGFATLIPAWAVNILGGDATTNGWLLSARGLGSLIGSLMIATFVSRGKRGLWWTVGSFVFPAFLLVFAFVRVLPLSLLALLGAGWGLIAMNNNSNNLVQSLVDDSVRGRVMSVYVMIFFGSMPIGSLIAGSVANRVGEPLTIILSAICLLLYAGLMYWRVPEIRQLD